MLNMLALRIVLSGRVQGVGFRPFVSRLAHKCGLVGWVQNCNGQVEIHVEGSEEALTTFKFTLLHQPPPLARLEDPLITEASVQKYPAFSILASSAQTGSDVHIPPDYFVCEDCLVEMREPNARRYRYPFINCTQCGPRYTLIDHLPYDRPNTSMRSFSLCRDCLTEYSDPLDRRYHAQPLACPNCGPTLMYHQAGFPKITGNEQALDICLKALRIGLIVAVKGVGGYHLICDASPQGPVPLLRERKYRPHQPLAVLVPWQGEDGLKLVRQLADLEATEQHLLLAAQRPIVLVQQRANTLLHQAIAPGLKEIGLMLPYSPLHYLLAAEFAAPLVVTSANISGEPVLTDAEEVEQRLSKVADAFLHHNRPIRRPADDSVTRRICGKMRSIRMGRGFAPIERKLPFQLPYPILAVGADLKNTVALAFRDRVVISPHIGNLGTLRSTTVFEAVIADLLRLYDVSPQLIVYDAHPSYCSSRWAKQQNIPQRQIFHHHAHASALAGEHALTEPMLIFTWDGTGYGTDGSIWGGEALFGIPGAWQRVGSIRPFSLPGGEKASREIWRCAQSLCWEQGLDWPDCPPNIELLHQAWQKRIMSPRTSSIGRLFDAVAALIGITQSTSYEGQAAMQMEAISSQNATAISLPLALNSSGIFISDWGPLLPFLLDKQISMAERSSVFHASLANSITSQAQAVQEKYGIKSIGLTGGVFQNRLLTEQAVSALTQLGLTVFLPTDIPSGDGGISFGQIIEAAYLNHHQL